jgi:hypothetical protein
MKSGLTIAATPAIAFTVTGEMTLDVRRLDARTAELAIALPGVKVSGQQRSHQASFDTLAAELEKTSVVSLNEGQLGEVRLPAGSSFFASSILRTLAAALQLPPATTSPGADGWEARETDATGPYRVAYRRVTGEHELEKRKLSYEPVSLGKSNIGNFSANLTPRVVSSRGRLTLVPDKAPAAQRLERLSYEESLQTELAQSSQVTADTTLKLTFAREITPAPSVDWVALRATTAPVLPGQAPRADDSTYDAARIGKYTFESALAELEQQAKDPKRNELFDKVRGEPEQPASLPEREERLRAQSKVFTAMAALLRSQPKTIPLALASVRRKSPAARPLLDALSSAGTPEAQLALASLIDDTALDPSVRRTAAFALTRTPKATPETVVTLSKHVDAPALRIHVLYGLGTICRRSRESGETQLADAILQTLLGALSRAKKPAHQVDALRGIANSGHPAAFDAVQPFFSSPSQKVRVAAVDSIRLMKGAEVDAILASSLASSEDDVQSAAVDAAAVREPSDTMITALQSASRAEDRTKPAIRLKLAQVMGQWLKQRPELRPTLEHLSTRDSSERVRQVAKLALGT